MLQNEKYKGDALLQKKFTVDFLEKKVKVNEGEVPQYYVQNSHPAIIEPLVFDQVQQEIARRKALGRSYSGVSIFASRIYCGECGGLYGVKVWGSNTKYRRVIWRCNQKYEYDSPCSTPHVSEDEIKAAFVDAVNELVERRDEVLASCRETIRALVDTDGLIAERERLAAELDILATDMRNHINQNARAAQDQGQYNVQHEQMAARFQSLKRQVDAIDETLQQRHGQRIELAAFVQALERVVAPLTEFDESLWGAMVERVTVFEGKRVVVRLRDSSPTESANGFEMMTGSAYGNLLSCPKMDFGYNGLYCL